jgi:hypothetical protein
MVNSNAPDKQGRNSLDLRQVSVHFVESLQLLLDKLSDQALGVAVSKVELWVHILGHLHNFRSRKGKHNAGKQLHFVDRSQSLLKRVGFFLVLA